MENDSHDCVLDYTRSASTSSTDTSLGSNRTSNSSIAEARGYDDTFQASALYERTNSRVADLQDNGAIHAEEPKFRCSYPGCQDISFKLKKDLTRHEKRHDSGATLWYCGCCQNLGHTYEGKARKDKVRDHLRNRHEKRESEGKTLGIQCSERACYTLLTASSCLVEHFRQEHPGYTSEALSQTTKGSRCDCDQKAEFWRLQNSQSGTSKHRAKSPLESKAKRGKHDIIPSQSLELAPPSIELRASPVSTTNSLAGIAPIEGWQYNVLWDRNPIWSPAIDAQDFAWCAGVPPLDYFADSNGAITNQDFAYYNEAINMDQAIDKLYPLQNLVPAAPQTQNSFHKFVLNNSKPAEFLAVRETQDFQKIVITLRGENEKYLCASSPITYNPEKETITLTGLPNPAIKKAVASLQSLLDRFSIRLGAKYLTSYSGVESEASTSRAYALDPSSARTNSNSERARIFPIRVKENRLLVGLWFKCILPALPEILTPTLGGTYSASLVSRGQVEIRAHPCIQIESPHVPALAAQKIIEDSLRDICDKEGHQPIWILFAQGSVRDLKGREEEGNDDAEEVADHQRRRFNLVRPYSKPGMGASLGLLCSKKVVATLGGYVLIDGDKYMLTSSHFVDESQERANMDIDDDDDSGTLTSPSRYDLKQMEDALKQTKRDLNSAINSLAQKTYGDRDIPEENLSDQRVTPDLHEAKKKSDDVTKLLDQVTRPPHEYIVGTFDMRSSETRTVSMPRHLAGILCLENNMTKLTHYMDWSLCKLKSQTGENRHKYRSNEDAMADRYVEEENHAIQPGDICYETCDADSGIAIHYVGQGSDHRSGVVNIPMLVSRHSFVTHEWAIMSSEGHQIPYTQVAGDSGAWVIRQHGNKLMGQVQAHSNGQVLLTPIDVIFVDLGKRCGVEVSLPPCSPDPGQFSNPSLARDLCAIPDTPPVRPYRFLLKSSESSPPCPDKQLVGTALSKTGPLESPSEIASPGDNNNTRGQVSSSLPCNSPSSLPDLTDSQQSPLTMLEFPESPRSSEGTKSPNRQAETVILPSKSLPTTVGRWTESEVPYLALDEQDGGQTLEFASPALKFKPYFLSRVSAIARTPTWPVDRRKKITKVVRGSRFSQHQSSQDHDAAISARSVHNMSAWLARRNEVISELKTILGLSISGVSTLPVPQDVSNREYSPVLEYYNAVA